MFSDGSHNYYTEDDFPWVHGIKFMFPGILHVIVCFLSRFSLVGAERVIYP
ncbi:hypothetical protein HMPREF1602_05539 [Escherichia coli 907889]|nr:hypothetical protein HMPREF9534_05219 [Escherichia coli MS 69-1]ESD29929.1 hypothetical protein HMPREF1602_05539 [Escherichia coli 907889]